MNTTTRDRTATTAGWVNLLLALWVLISPLVLGFGGNTALMWSNLAVGLPILLVTLASHLGYDILEPVIVPLGIWLFASTFVLGMSSVGLFWSNVVTAFLAVAGGPVSEGLRDANPASRVRT